MCQGDENGPTTPESSQDVIMPLIVGNMWIYNIYQIDNNTGEVSDIDEDILVINGIVEAGNTEWYTEGFVKLTNKIDGLWAWEDWSNGSQPSLYLKYPAGVGDTYSHPGPGNQVENVVVVSIDTLITIIGGQYSCYQYRVINIGTNGTTTWKIFASVSKGLIKGEKWFTRPDGSKFFDNSYELIGLVLKWLHNCLPD